MRVGCLRRSLRVGKMTVLPLTFLVLFCAVVQDAVTAPVGCGFDQNTLSFLGTPIEQALCLLRPVQKGAVLAPKLSSLPMPLQSLIGNKVSATAAQLDQYLTTLSIPTDALGGSTNAPISRAEGGERPFARYFVIHDTSNNVCVDNGEFARADHPDATWNRLSTWSNSKDAHLFLTRDGKLIAPQGRTFATPWRATKLESKFGTATRGLFLHIENVQLRVAERKPGMPVKRPDGTCINDLIAQTPGFSEIQMNRLALAYIAASVRRGSWMIPLFHAVLDNGISDGHDDPQNFELSSFAAQICQHLRLIDGSCGN